MVADDGGCAYKFESLTHALKRARARETGGTVEIENAPCINVYGICALYDFNGALRNVLMLTTSILLFLTLSVFALPRASSHNHCATIPPNARSAKKLITRKAQRTHNYLYSGRRGAVTALR